MNIHGIAVRNKKTKILIDFIQCNIGREALQVLGGISINMSNEYIASEEFISEEEIKNLK